MNSPQLNRLLSSFSIDLPEEILLDILDSYLNLPPPKLILSILVLSKSIYDRILPKLYHTLSLTSSPFTHPDRTPHDKLTLCAQSSSLANNFSFLPFSNLTHLYFWDSPSSRWDRQSDVLVILRLEELFVWDRLCHDSLASKLKHDSPICSTLCKLGFQDRLIAHPHRNWLLHCSKISHLFILSASFQGLQTVIQTLLPAFQTLQCVLVAPTQIMFRPARTEIPELPFGGDRRVAVVLHHLDYFKRYGHAFWSGERMMWKEIDEQIAKNTHLHELTIVDSLSTSGCSASPNLYCTNGQFSQSNLSFSGLRT
ncbi:hypothetical protein DL96DRAFT_1821487 [Flagelloscypha sp. PMI_526]|nr:hypothetical protein DL96DRAFT_1821487 [Flagelloscypha sp. PMI_526]